jgi:hypothetical protein
VVPAEILLGHDSLPAASNSMLSTGGAICAGPRKQFLRQPGTLLHGIQDSVLSGNRPEQEILCPSAVKVIHAGKEVQLQLWKEPDPIAPYRSRGTAVAIRF